MNDHARQTISATTATVKLPGIYTLAKNQHADVGRLGAEMARLRTACLPEHAGRTVILLDSGSIVSVATVQPTARLVTAAGKSK